MRRFSSKIAKILVAVIVFSSFGPHLAEAKILSRTNNNQQIQSQITDSVVFSNYKSGDRVVNWNNVQGADGYYIGIIPYGSEELIAEYATRAPQFDLLTFVGELRTELPTNEYNSYANKTYKLHVVPFCGEKQLQGDAELRAVSLKFAKQDIQQTASANVKNNNNNSSIGGKELLIFGIGIGTIGYLIGRN